MDSQKEYQKRIEKLREKALDRLTKSSCNIPASVAKETREVLHDLHVHQAETAIIRAKVQWEQTFDAVPDLIAIMDEQSTVVRVNKALSRRLGVEPKDCVGKKCYEVLHENRPHPSVCPHQQFYRTGKPSESEAYNRKLKGHFITTVLPFDPGDAENHWCVHIARDITDRKRAEKELLKLRNLESIGKLAGGMAHDFNNILTAVIGHVDLAILHVENREKQISHLHSAVESAYRAQASFPVAEDSPRDGRKILYMDDEKILWKVIESLLHRLGYEVDFAENGEQAISLFKKADERDQPYSALLMDLTIRSGPGGKEVLQQIHQIDAGAKAIALSGFSSDPVFEDCRKYGFVGALKKPFKTKRFLDVMSRVLNLSRSPES